MDHQCELCIAGLCLEHFGTSIPTIEDVPSLFLTEPVLSMSQNMVDGTLYYINSEEYADFFDESPTNIQSSAPPAADGRPAYLLGLRGESVVPRNRNIHGELDNVAPAQPRDPFIDNMTNNLGKAASMGPLTSYDLPLGGESTFNVHGNEGSLRHFMSVTFTLVAQAQLQDLLSLVIDNMVDDEGHQYVLNPHSLPLGGEAVLGSGSLHDTFYFLYSTGTDDTSSSSIAEMRASPPAPQPAPDGKHVSPTNQPIRRRISRQASNGKHVSPTNQPIHRRISRLASNKRRKKPANYRCPDKSCDADYTQKHNLKYHLNMHNNHRPYKCNYKDQGCDFDATAPSIAARHSITCEYRPENAEIRMG
ncbi:hypothetical protein F5887DRAFT_1283186 [Amanita rubescens]|nr:hypothetical protein F5887DRAFT_1283186 [Amanita rubescens]